MLDAPQAVFKGLESLFYHPADDFVNMAVKEVASLLELLFVRCREETRPIASRCLVAFIETVDVRPSIHETFAGISAIVDGEG